MSINTTGCVIESGFDPPDNSVAYVTTVQQGGRVERQQLTLATEAGYIRGDYFRLTYNTSSSEGGDTSYAATGCLEWGGSAGDVSDALSSLPAIGDIALPPDLLTLNTSGTDIFPSATIPLSTGQFVDGRLKRGDVVRVHGSQDGVDAKFSIKSVSEEGASVTFDTAFRAESGSGGLTVANVTRVVPDAVTVARSGTGKSVTEVQRIVITATSEVTPLDGQGFFRLRWAHDGAEETTECLEFGAEPGTVQDALEALGYDLDGSGVGFEEGDEGHVLVTRTGDASASSGYGYEYTFEFKGVAGVSTVVGNVEQLEVRDTAAWGSIWRTENCSGLNPHCAPSRYMYTHDACWCCCHYRVFVFCTDIGVGYASTASRCAWCGSCHHGRPHIFQKLDVRCDIRKRLSKLLPRNWTRILCLRWSASGQ